MKFPNGKILLKANYNHNDDLFDIRLISHTDGKKYCAYFIEWHEVSEGSDIRVLVKANEVIGTENNKTESITPVAIPPEIFKELERLHEVIRSTTHYTYRDWAKDSISRIHELYLNGRISINPRVD